MIPKITITKATMLVGPKRRSLKSIEKSKRRHSGRMVSAGNKSKKQLDAEDNDRETTYSLFEVSDVLFDNISLCCVLT